MVDVFFRGYGQWRLDIDKELSGLDMSFTEYLSDIYQADGVFRLNKNDETAYKHTKSLENFDIKYLLRSEHPDCEFSRYINSGGHIAQCYLIPYDIDDLYFCLESNQPKPIILTIAESYEPNTKEVLTIKPNETNKGRRPAQINLLLSTIDEMQYERLNIPVGGKKKTLEICLENKKVFSTESVFNAVWSELSKDGHISITGKDKYL